MAFDFEKNKKEIKIIEATLKTYNQIRKINKS
jgi:hypothetical protein